LQRLRNISWNLIAAVWLALLTVVSTPVFVAKLGLKLYGIIGIWLIFQAVMNLFDFGLGASLNRELSLLKSESNKSRMIGDTLKTIEIIYWLISLSCIILFIIITFIFGKYWINWESYGNIEITQVFLFMFFSLFFQFPNILYINGFIGLQKHKIAAILQIGGNTIKFGVAIFVVILTSNLVLFFLAQILISFIQTFTARLLLWKSISTKISERPIFKITVLKKIKIFTSQMALTSFLAVLIANLDRILVLKMLPTEDFGRYTLAITATGFLQLAIQPFYRSFFPKFSELYGNKDISNLENEYFIGNKLLSFSLIALSCIFFFFANDVLIIWLNKVDINLVNTFRLLILGMLLSGLGWLPAAFQQAIGWPNLHVNMMILALIIGIPITIILINFFGVLGATFIWFIHGITDITLGIYIMHKRVLKGRLKKWYLEVIVEPFLYFVPIVGISVYIKPVGMNNLNTFFWLLGTSFLVLIVWSIQIKKIFRKTVQ